MKVALIVLTVPVILIGCWDMAIARCGAQADEKLARLQEEMNNGERKSSLQQGGENRAN